MKSMLLVVCILSVAAVSMPVSAQESEEFYLNKIRKFRSMQTTGIVLMLSSIPAGALGWYFWKESNISSSEGYFDDLAEGMAESLLSDAFVTVAIASLAGGITMTIISSAKMNQYQTRLEKFRLGTYVRPGHAGFTLTLKL